MTITELIHQAASQLSGYFFLNQNDIAQQAQSSIEQLRQHSSFDSVGATITESLPRPVSHARLAPCIKYKKNAQQKYSYVLFNHSGKTLSLTVDEAVEKHSNNELICSGQNKQFKFGLLSEDVFGVKAMASQLQPVIVEVLNRKYKGSRKKPVTQDFLAGAEHSQDLMLIRPTANISAKSQLPESSSDADCVIYRIHNIGELGFDMKHLCFQMHQMDPHNTQVSGCTKTAWILYHCLHALKHYFDCQAEDQQRIHGDCKLENILCMVFQGYRFQFIDERSLSAIEQGLLNATLPYYPPDEVDFDTLPGPDLYALALSVHEVFFSYFLHHSNQTPQQQEIIAFLQRELQEWSQCHHENSITSNLERNQLEKTEEAADINSQYVHGYLVNELINLYDNDIPLVPHHHQFTDLLQLFIQLLDGRDGVCLDLETALVVINALQTQYFPHIKQQPKPLTLPQIHIKPSHVSPTPTLSDQSDAGLSPLAVPALALHRVSPTNTLKQSEIERTTPLRLFTPVAAHNVCPPNESSLKTHSEPSPVRQVTLSRNPHHLNTTACSLAKRREKYTPPQREPFRQCQWS